MLLSRAAFSKQDRQQLWIPASFDSKAAKEAVFWFSLVTDISMIVLFTGTVGGIQFRIGMLLAFFALVTAYGLASISNIGHCGCTAPKRFLGNAAKKLVVRNCFLASLVTLGVFGPKASSLLGRPELLLLPAAAPLLGIFVLFVRARFQRPPRTVMRTLRLARWV